MTRRDLFDLILLAAIWGGSFLFMRLGAAEFGPAALAGLRVCGAALVLVPLLIRQRQLAALRAHAVPLVVVGLSNSAIPFLCFGYAALHISAGLSSIFNAATPLFTALIAWLWLRERLGSGRALGLAIGFAGVVGLAANKAGFKPGAEGWSATLAIAACITATLCYGFAANYSRRRLAGVAPMVSAAGSQLGAALLLLPLAVVFWPARMPGATAWISAGLLALLCTGLAYVLFFRLIARVGPANAVTVTFLIPAFAVAWGALFLGEPLTLAMGLGCAVIVTGTALATGFVKGPARQS